MNSHVAKYILRMTEWADEIATLANQRTFDPRKDVLGIFHPHLVLSKWHENLSLFLK